MMIIKKALQSKSVNIFDMGIQGHLESKANILLIDFYIDQIKEGVWQGVCKFKVNGDELAAVSVTRNLSNLTEDLMEKIRIQLPVEYKTQRQNSIYKGIYSV